jgi:glycosyltransferase involved in cell wall biosynthesis
MKLFEYMAFSKPILCSDLPVLREILEDGSSALMLPSDQPEVWAKAIEELAEDNQRSTALGEAALRVLKSNYSWDERARRVIEFCS